MAVIEQVGAREILDSRGNPTVEVEVALDDGTLARAAVPSGASTGEHEAVELRDGDPPRYGGKGVEKAVAAVLDEIGPELIGMEAIDQRVIDQRLVDLDGTPDKGRLGANALLGVSLAVAKAAAESSGLELFRYVGGPNAHVLPVPMMNIINGGAHADSSVDVQEFMIAPVGADRSARRCAGAPRSTTRSSRVLKSEGLATGLGDEGGFAPDLPGTTAALDLIAGPSTRPATRWAATSCWPWTWRPRSSTPTASTPTRASKLRADEISAVYAELVDAYPMVSIEDPLSEDDWDGWIALTTQLGRPGADRRRRPVRHQPRAARGRHRPRRRERAAGQGQPDRHAVGDPGRRDAGAQLRATAA